MVASMLVAFPSNTPSIQNHGSPRATYQDSHGHMSTVYHIQASHNSHLVSEETNMPTNNLNGPFIDQPLFNECIILHLRAVHVMIKWSFNLIHIIVWYSTMIVQTMSRRLTPSYNLQRLFICTEVPNSLGFSLTCSSCTLS